MTFMEVLYVLHDSGAEIMIAAIAIAVLLYEIYSAEGWD